MLFKKRRHLVLNHRLLKGRLHGFGDGTGEGGVDKRLDQYKTGFG